MEMEKQLDLASVALACANTGQIVSFESHDLLIPERYTDYEFGVNYWITEKVLGEGERYIVLAIQAIDENSLKTRKKGDWIPEVNAHVYQTYFNMCDVLLTDILQRQLDIKHMDDVDAKVIITGEGLCGQIASLMGIGFGAHTVFTFGMPLFATNKFMKKNPSKGAQFDLSVHGRYVSPFTLRKPLGDLMWLEWNDGDVEGCSWVFSSDKSYLKSYLMRSVL